MRSFLSILFCLLAANGFLSASAQEQALPTLVGGRTQYRARLLEIAKKRDAQVERITQDYLRGLGALETAYQQRGDLDALIAVRKEISAVREAKRIDGSRDAADAQVAKLRVQARKRSDAAARSIIRFRLMR